MDQHTTYRAGQRADTAAPNTVSGSAGPARPWELQTVKSDHGTYVLRFNLITGDCFYLDLTRGGTIANGWQLIPSGMGVSDAGVTDVTDVTGVTPASGHATGHAKADKADKAEKVPAGSI